MGAEGGSERKIDILQQLDKDFNGDLEAADPRQVLKRQIKAGKGDGPSVWEQMAASIIHDDDNKPRPQSGDVGQDHMLGLREPTQKEMETLRSISDCIVRFNVYKAKHLSNPHGEFGMPDPIVQVTTDNLTNNKAKFVTATIEDTCNPKWNHEQVLQNISELNSLLLTVYDQDPGVEKVEESEILGELRLDPNLWWPHGLPKKSHVLKKSGGRGQISIEITIEDLVDLRDLHPFYQLTKPAPASVPKKESDQRVSFGGTETMEMEPAKSSGKDKGKKASKDKKTAKGSDNKTAKGSGSSRK